MCQNCSNVLLFCLIYLFLMYLCLQIFTMTIVGLLIGLTLAAQRVCKMLASENMQFLKLAFWVKSLFIMLLVPLILLIYLSKSLYRMPSLSTLLFIVMFFVLRLDGGSSTLSPRSHTMMSQFIGGLQSHNEWGYVILSVHPSLLLSSWHFSVNFFIT